MRTATDGPNITYGNDNPQQKSNTDAGPNVNYQGGSLLDSRYVSAATGPGSAEVVPAWFSTSSLELLNYCPTAASATALVSAATPTANTPLTLVSTSSSTTGVGVSVPIAPAGTAIQPTIAATTAALAIDFGFATGTTTSAAATNTIVTITGPQSAAIANTQFFPGQKIIILGAGAGGANLLTTVLATNFRAAAGSTVTSTANTILIANGASTAVTSALIGTLDPVYGVVALPMQKAGAIGLWDPTQSGSRVLQYVASAAYAGTVTVRGWDLYGFPMTETVTMNGTTVVNGLKAFKYIGSITPSLTSASTISVGTSVTIGYPMRVDLWEFTNSFYNQSFYAAPTTNSGVFTAASTATPSSTTGDVRGTVSFGTLTSGQRCVVYGNPRMLQCIQADNIVPATLVGLTQA